MAAPKAAAGARKPRKKDKKNIPGWSGSHQVDLQQHNHFDH